MNRPQYDEEDGIRGKAGEVAVRAWMKRRGFHEVTQYPNGEYREDLYCQSEEEAFYLEVERRSMTWQFGLFPFPEINVPKGRKIKSETIFIAITADMSHGIVLFGFDILAAQTHPETNRRSPTQKETMRKVPRERALPVDLRRCDHRTFAELNYNRVALAMQTETDAVKRCILGCRPPYGVTQEQWEAWRRPYVATAIRPPEKWLFE